MPEYTRASNGPNRVEQRNKKRFFSPLTALIMLNRAFGIYHFIVRSSDFINFSIVDARGPPDSSSYANDLKWMLMIFLSISHLTSPFPFDIWSHTKHFQLNASLIFDLCESVSVFIFLISPFIIFYFLSFFISFFHCLSLSLALARSLLAEHHQFPSDIIKLLLLFLMNSIHNNRGALSLIVYADLADEIWMTPSDIKTIWTDCVRFSQT